VIASEFVMKIIMLSHATALIAGCIYSISAGPSYAQTILGADQQRGLLARDVCLAMSTNFATGDSITYENGRFRVVKGTQSITVYEGATPLATVPGFTYTEYSHCLDIVLSGVESSRPAPDAKGTVEALTAGNELGEIQSIGLCAQSAAMGGLYIGDMQSDNAPVQMEYLEKLVLSVSKSITRRVKRFSNKEIRLTLVNDLQFYNYVQGRLVPYFSIDAIQDSTDVVSDATPSGYEDYVDIGRIAGRMRRAFLYGTVFSFLLQRPPNPGVAYRAQMYLPRSLQCLENSYQRDRANIYEYARRLGISLQVPEFNQAVSNGSRLVPNGDNVWAERFFDERVTVRLRDAITGHR
jgi:hypothetical protein